MNQPNVSISIIIYGNPKVGKTWLMTTAPKPMLVLDVEAGGIRFTPGKKTIWSDFDSPPPETDDLCIAQINTWDDYLKVRSWIVSGSLGFKSLGIDSLMELQDRLKESESFRNPAQLQIQEWATMLYEMGKVINEIRDAGLQYGYETVVFVIGETEKNSKTLPMLQGKIAEKISHKVDAIGHYYTARDEDGILHRILQLTPDDNVVAGHRLGDCVDDYIIDPNLSEIVSTVIDRIQTTYT